MTSPFRFSATLEETSVNDRGTTRDGYTQYRRYWRASRSRAVLLLIHGIAEHSGRYEHVARQFVDAGVSVVAIDLRGFGESGGQRAHLESFDQYNDDVEDQLLEVRRLGLPTFMLGHSMGGLVVASYALSARPQPDRVILSSPPLVASVPAWMVQRLIALGSAMPHAKVKLPLKLGDLSSDPAVGEAYAADPLVNTTSTLGLVAAMLAASLAVQADLSDWSADALVIHGLDDKIVPPVASEELGQNPSVERLTYPAGRHELLNEQFGPDVVDDVLRWMNSRF